MPADPMKIEEPTSVRSRSSIVLKRCVGSKLRARRITASTRAGRTGAVSFKGRGFCSTMARTMAADDPKRYLAVMSKAQRKGRIFIDYLRNGRGSTAIASYSLRARDGFPVATPITWSELRNLNGGDAFTIATIQNRLTHLASDPWSELCSHPTKITAKMARDVGVV